MEKKHWDELYGLRKDNKEMVSEIRKLILRVKTLEKRNRELLYIVTQEKNNIEKQTSSLSNSEFDMLTKISFYKYCSINDIIGDTTLTERQNNYIMLKLRTKGYIIKNGYGRWAMYKRIG